MCWHCLWQKLLPDWKLPEIGYTVADTQPPRRQNEVVAEKIAVEYVVRQSLLSDNKVALVTVKKYRKEVLENGISNQ